MKNKYFTDMSTSVFNTCSLNDVNNGGDSAASQESIESKFFK